ncbi:MAG: FYVE zinc finger domain-containing protein [Myxococcaceae bacterium]|nr:FYVE zinc finger domain-containing protein [Myxococcaceae bacterium]MBH2006875.1 FYVE zinc finger domain-containing protein [Myxococcaceae bacterium]
MNRIFSVVLLVSVSSTNLMAWGLVRERPVWLHDALAETARIGQQIRESLREVKFFSLGSALTPLGRIGANYHEQINERYKRINALRREALSKRQQGKASEALEAEEELLELIELGALPEGLQQEEASQLNLDVMEAAPGKLFLFGDGREHLVPGVRLAPGQSASSSSSPTSSLATPLQPQDLASDCHECHKKFSFFKRKYNCRACGEIVCSDCLVASIPTLGYPDSKKACGSCVEKYRKTQQVRPQAERVQELVSEFEQQANVNTSTRDTILSAAGTVLNSLSSMVPAPFDSVVSMAQNVVSLAQTAASNRAESERLAARISRINMAMMKLLKEGDTPLAQRAANDLKKVFEDAIKLLEKFQQDSNRTFVERVQATWQQYSCSTADQFNSIHNDLTMIMNDRQFALTVDQKNRMQAPSLDEIKSSFQEELSHVSEEIKRQSETMGHRLTQLESNLQHYLDEFLHVQSRPISSLCSFKKFLELDPHSLKQVLIGLALPEYEQIINFLHSKMVTGQWFMNEENKVRSIIEGGMSDVQAVKDAYSESYKCLKHTVVERFQKELQDLNMRAQNFPALERQECKNLEMEESTDRHLLISGFIERAASLLSDENQLLRESVALEEQRYRSSLEGQEFEELSVRLKAAKMVRTPPRNVSLAHKEQSIAGFKQLRGLEWRVYRGDRIEDSRQVPIIESAEVDAVAGSVANAGWRLPTIWELENLFLEGRSADFQVDLNFAWSSTLIDGVAVMGDKWRLNLLNGGLCSRYLGYRGIILFVRELKSERVRTGRLAAMSRTGSWEDLCNE